eukprot:261308-Ditylum_brightwellii.AAC.1
MRHCSAKGGGGLLFDGEIENYCIYAKGLVLQRASLPRKRYRKASSKKPGSPKDISSKKEILQIRGIVDCSWMGHMGHQCIYTGSL